MISVREGIGYRVMGDYMAYWHEVYTVHIETSKLLLSSNVIPFRDQGTTLFSSTEANISYPNEANFS